MKRRTLQWIAGIGGLILLLVVASGCSGKSNTIEASGGPEPNFTTDNIYVSIDELKQEFDRGAKMIILDARPRQDYEMDHIAGAISMPFFEVEQRYKELPRDTWIVTYCACPRAEAEEAANILQAKGFKKVKVLYDGYFEWLARAYPIVQGSEPS